MLHLFLLDDDTDANGTVAIAIWETGFVLRGLIGVIIFISLLNQVDFLYRNG